MTRNSCYHAILHALAAKFYNDLPEQEKPKRENYVSALQENLRGFTAPVADDPPWKLWMKVQQGRMKMGFQERMNAPQKKMSAGELLFLADIALHAHTGSHAICLPWETVESVSAFKIDRNVKVCDLVSAGLPDSVWVEWPKIMTITSPPWITRTIGILISRLLLLDAPIEYLRAMTAPRLPNEDDTIEMIRALAQSVTNGLPCVGYRLTIVQQDAIDYRFITSLFGHEHKEALVNMLTLYKEVSDRDNRKFKQTEQAWTNIAVRILLLAAYKKWFLAGETNVCADSSLLSCLKAKNGSFFCQKGTQEKQIGVRPEYHPAHPFRVESE